MALTYSKLMDIAVLPKSSNLDLSACQAIYINPASTTSYVSEIEIHNTNSSSSASVALFLVPNVSGSTGTAAMSCETVRLTLSAYDTVFIEPKYPYVLTSTSDAFFGVASVSTVNISLRGGKDIS